MYDLIIIGGGPAGMTAAVYAIRRHLKILLISDYLGGKTNFHMVLPKSETQQPVRGIETVDRFRRELEYLDFVRHAGTVSDITKQGEIFTVRSMTGLDWTAKSVLLATGTQVKQLDVPGEESYAGYGLSYSAISYAPLFIDKHSVVIGDNDLALRAVAELMQTSATVTLVSPTPGLLDSPLGKRLISEQMKVILLEGYQVKEIRGDGFAEQVVLETPGGGETIIDADGVFVELGLIPNSDPVKDLATLDELGRVIVNNRNQTSCPGLFAAGDVTNVYAEQVLIAVGEGAKAALSAYEYLLEQG